MALSLQQVQRQSQQLIMTPQMQQSIQLLQMNTLELEQLAQAELEENPFLELAEEREDDEAPVSEPATENPEPVAAAEEDFLGSDIPESMMAKTENGESDGAHEEDFLAPVEREFSELHDGEFPTERPETPEESRAGDEAEGDIPEGAADLAMSDQPEQYDKVDVSWDEYYDDAENSTYTRDPDEEEHDFTEYTPAKISLYEHLMRQVRLSALNGVAMEIGEYLVGCIDSDGYLPADCLSEAAEKFNVPMTEIERVLSIIQEFEPNGVAARTPAECLLNQMKALGSYSELAREVLTGHFEDLQRKKFKPIAKATNAKEEDILDIYQKVGRLEPKPGRAYSTDSAHYITPDVVVKLFDGELAVYLNEAPTTHLSINKFYRRMMRMQSKALTKEDKDFAVEKFRNALMLIKNIEKRKSTILRVTESIMNVQREFLDKGVEALKPLTLRVVADMVGMHESTIARVTSKKYVETPQGVFLLKYFFSSGIGTSDGSGDAVSSRSIKNKLTDLIAGENAKKPLSDQKIAEILNRDGFNIARRTVAKYREQLKILPAKLRREA